MNPKTKVLLDLYTFYGHAHPPHPDNVLWNGAHNQIDIESWLAHSFHPIQHNREELRPFVARFRLLGVKVTGWDDD